MSEWNAETAEWYAEKYGEYATNRLAVDALDIASDAVVVDVGCGTGSALRHIAARVPDGTLIGVDPISRMLEIARERAAKHPHGKRIEFREGPAAALPVSDGVADLVLAFDSIDHWQDRDAGFAELRRVLRDRGRLVVVKDGGVPGGADARRAFLADLSRSGFGVDEERSLCEGEVACTMWQCSLVR